MKNEGLKKHPITVSYTSSVIKYPHDLLHMIEFAQVITEMQIKVVELRTKNADIKIINKACLTIDKLINIYERFDKLYFNVNFHVQKNFHLQKEIMDQREVILNQQKEIDKFKQAEEWGKKQE